MSTFFQWLDRLFFSQKKSIQLQPDNIPKKQSIIPIDNTPQEIELICYQIEKTIENIRANIRVNKDQAEQQTLQCRRLIIQLDHLMNYPQSLDSK